ncbi:hypothetical protein Ddye_024688 [Dipteronia dyeriana]|uniref:Uncharacterized protein n=1 Tax=Dipteronia dyeriana TaxID=168575 RepID=A0AAD9TWB6_9ROSI|nr:hypothetical protein Ddye_024688 [Dipteronia dyeriana]
MVNGNNHEQVILIFQSVFTVGLPNKMMDQPGKNAISNFQTRTSKTNDIIQELESVLNVDRSTLLVGTASAVGETKFCSTREEEEGKEAKSLQEQRESWDIQRMTQTSGQASVVGGAIKFVKELEQLFQSLEAQKLQLVKSLTSCKENSSSTNKFLPPNLSQFFVYHHQTTRSKIPRKYITSKAALDDIEDTLINGETCKFPNHLLHFTSPFFTLMSPPRTPLSSILSALRWPSNIKNELMLEYAEADLNRGHGSTYSRLKDHLTSLPWLSSGDF